MNGDEAKVNMLQKRIHAVVAQVFIQDKTGGLHAIFEGQKRLFVGLQNIVCQDILADFPIVACAGQWAGQVFQVVQMWERVNGNAFGKLLVKVGEGLSFQVFFDLAEPFRFGDRGEFIEKFCLFHDVLFWSWLWRAWAFVLGKSTKKAMRNWEIGITIRLNARTNC